MRKDHYTPPSKWTKEYAQALKLGDVHFKVYAYCEGGPESHRTGLYFVTLGAIAEMVREERETVQAVLDDLEQVGLAFFDGESGVIWVPSVCAEQFRWKGHAKPLDHKVTEAKAHISNLPASPLVARFLAVWPVFAEGACQGASEGACQGSTSSYPYPSSPQTRPKGPETPAGAELKAVSGGAA